MRNEKPPLLPPRVEVVRRHCSQNESPTLIRTGRQGGRTLAKNLSYRAVKRYFGHCTLLWHLSTTHPAKALDTYSLLWPSFADGERPKRGRCRQRLWVMKRVFIAKEKKSVSCWKASLRHNWELVCVAGLTTSRIQNTPEISIYVSLDAWPTKLNYTELGMYCTLGFTIVVF